MSLKNLPPLGAVQQLLGFCIYLAERDEEVPGLLFSAGLGLESSSDGNGCDRYLKQAIQE